MQQDKLLDIDLDAEATNPVTLMLFDDELERAKAMAERFGMTVAGYLLSLCVDDLNNHPTTNRSN